MKKSSPPFKGGVAAFRGRGGCHTLALSISDYVEYVNLTLNICQVETTTPSAEAASTPPLKGGKPLSDYVDCVSLTLNICQVETTTPSAEAAFTPPLKGGEPLIFQLRSQGVAPGKLEV